MTLRAGWPETGLDAAAATNEPRGEGRRHRTPAPRAGKTRTALLDATEALVAESGPAALTHRNVAARAGVHTALLNYHFQGMANLVEEMVARKAGRLAEAWTESLSRLPAPEPDAEAVVHAYWAPFDRMDEVPGEWQRYLRATAHVLHDASMAAVRARHFGRVEARFVSALSAAVPRLSAADVATAFQTIRLVLDHERLEICKRLASGGPPPRDAPGGTGVATKLRLLARGLCALP